MSLQYGILGLLNYAPMSGYQLKTLFSKSINHIWTASLSQIYRELNALVGKDYVSAEIIPQEDRPDKKVYTITESGRTAFQEWLHEEPKKVLSPKRDEFMLRVFFGSSMTNEALQEYFKYFLSGIETYDVFTEGTGKRAFMSMIKKDIDKGQELNLDREKLYWNFTLRRLQLTMEALRTWAEECIETLEHME